MGFNKIILMGRLTKDPEIRYSQGENQIAIARFSLAVNRRWKREGEPEADFFNCTVFGRQADFVEKYLRKGSQIIISGRVQNDNYTNKEGQKVYSVKVIVEEIDFAESKNAAENHASYPEGTRPAPGEAAKDGFMTIPEGEEELPFN
ncbi:MAG: single-stranded DNA-binding protein [Bacteroides sp.]|nr:single-stranded DNA-binding protein [Bacteroides sp.]MCM1550530.1 single-stranded DNA-binding protein [Clostridium sp.]